MLAAIPSPSSGVLHIGPVNLHAYGICIALAVLAAVWLSSKRWVARGGTTEDITVIAVWAVPAGVVGARIYHVITDFEIYRHDLGRMFYIWDGGLGIWGGIAAGVGAGVLVARHRKLAVLPLLDAVAPALALAQAIGRWGNYFNQELFGRPTGLPWGLHIDLANRPPAFVRYSTFQPTFLYECLWDLFVCASLLLVDKRLSPKPGRLFLLYVAMYTFGRFFIERLRIDFAHTFLGLRINDWTSLLLFLAASGWLLVLVLRDRKARMTETF